VAAKLGRRLAPATVRQRPVAGDLAKAVASWTAIHAAKSRARTEKLVELAIIESTRLLVLGHLSLAVAVAAVAHCGGCHFPEPHQKC